MARRKKVQRVQTSLRIDKRVLADLDKIAGKLDISRNALIERWLRTNCTMFAAMDKEKGGLFELLEEQIIEAAEMAAAAALKQAREEGR